ncbi:MAG: type II/IV secretion system protein, partial [Candidatus Omnitrophica bacterium]|nr:type II/IV secretion system protein [Candidatus Omnitrophota bacterium]
IKLNAELIYRAKGCSKCNQIGYKGRTCIAEVMLVDRQIRELIGQHVSYSQLREKARQLGILSLYESGLKKVEEGVTSLEEALSVTMEI